MRKIKFGDGGKVAPKKGSSLYEALKKEQAMPPMVRLPPSGEDSIGKKPQVTKKYAKGGSVKKYADGGNVATSGSPTNAFVPPQQGMGQLPNLNNPQVGIGQFPMQAASVYPPPGGPRQFKKGGAVSKFKKGGAVSASLMKGKKDDEGGMFKRRDKGVAPDGPDKILKTFADYGSDPAVRALIKAGAVTDNDGNRYSREQHDRFIAGRREKYGFKTGGAVSASRRGDGIASKGKTKGKFV